MKAGARDVVRLPLRIAAGARLHGSPRVVPGRWQAGWPALSAIPSPHSVGCRSWSTAYGRPAGALRFWLRILVSGRFFCRWVAPRRGRDWLVEIFVFEFVTGGGFLGQEIPPPSLLAEGRAMLGALAADFGRLPQVRVTTTCDQRFPLPLPGCQVSEVATPAAWEQEFARLAGRAEWTVVIAPEFDDLLYSSAARALAAGGRLLGPSPAWIALAADKHRTAEALQATGVPVPAGIRLEQGQLLPVRFAYPAVLKRVDGAGSLDVHSIRDATAAGDYGPVPRASRLERQVEGMPASVAVLCGPSGYQALAAGRQKISSDGRFSYQGGCLPLDAARARRARQLALAAMTAVPGAVGYVGVDIVLGDDAAEDVVVEINPRLTTSYVGLRAAYRQNLAQRMLELACGGQPSEEEVTEQVDFDADGTVRCLGASGNVA